jgi:long-chain acyl-CoA synthetase
LAETTLPQFLLRHARSRPRDPAVREKEKGIWQEWTWAEYLDHVRWIALGLVHLGFERGDKLAIISDNRPQAYWGMVAAQAVGGVAVAVYQDAIVKEVQYIIDHSDAKFVLAEDQEQVDKLLELKGGLTKVRKIIFDDPKGLRHYADTMLMSLGEVERRGQAVDRERPGFFDDLVNGVAPDDVALLCYTSGTTGLPKGAMVSHFNLISAIEGIQQLEGYKPTDQALAYLPPAWVGDSFWSLAASLVIGFTINCPERPETVLADLREIGPEVFVAPPRIWENLVSLVQVKMEDASPLKRRLYRWLMPAGEEVTRLRMERQPVPLRLRLLSALGELCAFAPLRDHLGMRRIRYAYSGGAALGPEVFLFFRALGINLKQVYGQTEISAVSFVQRDGDVKLGTVGRPLPHTEVKLTEMGEVACKSPGVFLGYYKSPEATAEVLRDGWLYSGDAGMFDPDGHLIVIDRAKDVTSLANGTKFAPQYIENKLKFTPYVKEAVAVGQDRPYVAAMINIDMENVAKWAERRQITYTTYTDLAQKREVYDLIGREVERVNRDLPESTRILKYLLLHKELDPDDEEVTRTRKVRRKFVSQKYAPIIEALYSDAAVVPVTSVITYQDGRQATIQTELAIRTVGSVPEPVGA